MEDFHTTERERWRTFTQQRERWGTFTQKREIEDFHTTEIECVLKTEKKRCFA